MNNTYYNGLEVASGLYHIAEPAGVCSSLILGDDYGLVVDTGYGFADLHSYIRTLTDLPLILVNTHGHLDHAGGNFHFRETAYIHPFEFDVYQSYQENKPKMLQYIENRVKAGKAHYPFTPDFDLESYLQFKHVSFRTLEDRQLFQLGNRTVEVLYLPGHTCGSIALYDHSSQTLLTGDSVGESIWIMFDHSAPPEEFARRLAWIRTHFDIRQVLYSHRQQPYPPQMIDHTLHALAVRSPETSTIFIHPRDGYKALHHKEPIDDIPGVNVIHLVYPLPNSSANRK